MSKKRVLIVEDDRKSLYALTAVLEQHGCAVSGYGSPTEVPLDTAGFHAAVIDLRLPDTPGSEFAAELKRRNPEMRIVFVTAYSADENGDLDGSPLLVKPLNVQELLTHL